MPPLGWRFRWRLLKHRVRRLARSPQPARDDWRPAGGPILVIAPHPDDEVIGCGGAIHRHALAGDPITVLCLTSGRRSSGYPWLTLEQRGALREAESLASARVLGIPEVLFFRAPDGELEHNDNLTHFTAHLAELLSARRPRIIFTPHSADAHPDHQATWRIFSSALPAAALDPAPQILQYEVWTPLAADFAVDITPFLRRKLRALRCHHVALDAFDYIATVKGLAAYRSGQLLGRPGYAEAFRRLS